MCDRLAEIEARLDAANTESPWAWEPHGDSGSWSVGIVYGDNDEPLAGRLEPGQGEVVECIAEGGVDCTDADADLIAAAPQYLRDLLAVAKAAQEVMRAWEAEDILATNGGAAWIHDLDAALTDLDRREGTP